MFVFLSKLLPLLIYPAGVTCLLLIASLIIRKDGWRRVIILFALLILWVSGNRWVSLSVVRSLEWRYLPQENIPQAQAIVILGGGTDAADYPRPMVDLTGAGDRVLYGGYLYKQGKAPYILLSGGNIAWMGARSTTPAEQMAEVLALMEIPQEVMLLQTESLNTYQDALYSSQMLKEMGITRIVLVTSALHMPRSVGLFEKQGMEVIPAPTDYRVTQKQWDNLKNPAVETQLINLIPNVSNMASLTNALKEYIGIAVYRLRHWI